VDPVTRQVAAFVL